VSRYISLPFRNRLEAGRFLAPRLASCADREDADVIVLGLARGGVPVGYAVARALNVLLDVLVVRKLGVPGHEELAMGAIASGMVRVCASAATLEDVTAREDREMGRRERQYRDSRIAQDFEHKIVILTDDGLATGATMRAAVMSPRQHKIARCVVAVPVGPPDTCAKMQNEADEVICGVTPEPLQRFEAETLDRAATFLMPKDFLRFKLTGELGTDESDASGSGIFNVRQRLWADDVIERLELPRSMFPKVHASADVVGPLSQEAAAQLGLRHGIPVSAGCADQPAQAVGNGLIDPPLGSVTIGTGGQVFVPLNQPLMDAELRLHTFCHAPQARWYLLGAMLSAACVYLAEILAFATLGSKEKLPNMQTMRFRTSLGKIPFL
jgi:putative phosphoribosyl transferase